MLKLWLLTCCSKCSSHNALQSHTCSISQPNPKVCNLDGLTHKECWRELAGQKKYFSELKKGQGTSFPCKRRVRGINTPLLKSSCCNCQCRPVRLVPQTGLFKSTSRYTQTGLTGLGQRSPNPSLGAPLGPPSQHLIIQVAQSHFSWVFSQDSHFGVL